MRTLAARRRRARLDARAAVTARLSGLPCWGGLAGSAVRWSAAATADELSSVTLSAVRWAAVALKEDPVDVLAALLTGRAAIEVLPADQARGEL